MKTTSTELEGREGLGIREMPIVISQRTIFGWLGELIDGGVISLFPICDY